jgi:hypothetical protein
MSATRGLSVEPAQYFYRLTFRPVSATGRSALSLEWPVFERRHPCRRSRPARAVAQRQPFERHNSLFDSCSFLPQLSNYFPEFHLGKIWHSPRGASSASDKVLRPTVYRAGQARSSARSPRSQNAPTCVTVPTDLRRSPVRARSGWLNALHPPSKARVTAITAAVCCSNSDYGVLVPLEPPAPSGEVSRHLEYHQTLMVLPIHAILSTVTRVSI